MPKISFNYKFSKSFNKIGPNDVIGGKVFITNDSNKPKPLKSLKVSLIQRHSYYRQEDRRWAKKRNTINKWDIHRSKDTILVPGILEEIPFNLTLPTSKFWNRGRFRTEDQIRDWRVELSFSYKIGTISRNGAIVVLPVKGSDVVPAIVGKDIQDDSYIEAPIENSDTRFCTYCGEKISVQSTVCRYCGGRL